MSSTIFRASIGVIVLVLMGAEVSRADLFAITFGSRDVLRIDSNTGNITRTYSFPDWIPAGPSVRSLAFDGRTLYLTRPNSGGFFANELLRVDVVDNVWLPPSYLETNIPLGPPNGLLTGLGHHRDEFGLGSLIGVSNNTPAPPTSHLFQYPEFPGFFEPFQFNINIPPGPLPSDFYAEGADVDPATGDIWVTGDQRNEGGMVVGHPIMCVDLGGNVLETITPDLEFPVMLRGLGFDRGELFVAGREIPAFANNIYQIDRTTGAVLNTFPLPGSGLGTPPMGGLTGGEVVPEPAAAVLAMLGLLGTVGSARRLSIGR